MRYQTDATPFSIIPMVNSGLYSGNILVSTWDGVLNSTFRINLGKKSSNLDQEFLLTSDFIEKRLPEILSNTVDPKPEIPDVFIEISPEDTDPLEPQERANNYRSWAISRFIYSRDNYTR